MLEQTPPHPNLTPNPSPRQERGKEEGERKKSLNKGELISIAFELGFIIALPIVVFALAGKWLDGKIGTMPLFTLIGILFAIVSTSVWIYRRFKGYFNRMSSSGPRQVGEPGVPEKKDGFPPSPRP